jgi:dipeptidyl aminopeptidase/acylaminoacyl peptidase
MHRLRTLTVVACIILPSVGIAQRSPSDSTVKPAAAAAHNRLLTRADMAAWKSIRTPAVSNDGKWFAYVLAPNEGDAEVVARPVADGGKEQRFPIGEPGQAGFGAAPGGGRGGRGGAVAAGPLQLSSDGKWLAFTIYPTHREAQRLRQLRRPLQNKVALVNLATGEKKEFDKMRRFSFSGDKPTWIAMQAYAPEAASGGAAPTPAVGGAASSAATAPRVEGSDLVLYGLTSGETVNVGNVLDFDFDDAGNYLAYTIDAHDQIGNGVQLRSLKTDVVRALDADQAMYRQLSWADSGLALAVLRGKADTVTKDTLWSVVAFTDFAANGTAKKTVFDPKLATDFPAGMKVSGDRTPRFASDFSAIFFGIRDARRPEPRPMMAGREAGQNANGRGNPSPVQAGAPGTGGAVNQPRLGPDTDEELPSLVLWNARDPRLQSQQIVQEQQDKQYSYLSEFRLADRKFVRLSDDALRSVTLMPKEQYAYGVDSREYDQVASYNGRAYRDVYAVDLKTGARKLLVKQHHSFTIPSPDGKQLLTWGKDGQYHVIDVVTGEDRNITKNVPTSFVDTEDDHNNLYPPAINPLFANVGWSKDGSSVLLSDNWDVWKVPANGSGAAVNLTGDGKATRVRYQRRYTFDPQEKGIDLSKPLYFSIYGEWTKKNGIARVDPGKAGAKRLVFDDASFNFSKAKDADVFFYTRQTFVNFPNVYVASADLSSGRQLTDANPQQKEFAWSSGARLINYVSDKGDSLQGALYLPANYEPGKKYPLLVTIYEKRSQGLHVYTSPSETRTPDPSVYTNRGYAVLDPDIVYRVNDPGMSAVWCVVPAVKAAIATGLVDSSKVGLWGHSWGGYQTAFLVTQTDIFAAAIAGAPLTDMVSMYSSVYWNTGGTNQAIFEASQGRFKGNFIDNYDAYIRNSPAFHAKNVKTPLIILHNDKDGAVDFNQGITYFNTLRQLGKDVVLLEYVGENHGLQRPVNQKDYAVRMGEWFDHFLEGKPAPEWMTNGIPRIKMEDHLKERRDQDKASRTPIVP